MQDSQRFTRGLEIRREVLGNEYVDNNLAGSDEFMMTFQHIVTELAVLKKSRFTRRAHLPLV